MNVTNPIRAGPEKHIRHTLNNVEGLISQHTLVMSFRWNVSGNRIKNRDQDNDRSCFGANRPPLVGILYE